MYSEYEMACRGTRTKGGGAAVRRCGGAAVRRCGGAAVRRRIVGGIIWCAFVFFDRLCSGTKIFMLECSLLGTPAVGH